MKCKLMLIAAVAYAAVALTACMAFAADTVASIAPPEYTIGIQSTMQTVVSFVFGLVGAGIAFAANKLLGKGGKFELDAEHQIYLNHAITSGLSLGEAKVRGMVGNIKDPTIQNQLVATAANFVLASVPGLLAKYNITPQKLRDLIVDKLDGDAEKAALAEQTHV